MQLLKTHKLSIHLLISFFLFYFILCFIFVFYPPWQIVLSWFFIVFFLGSIFQNKKLINTGLLNRTIVTLIVILVFLFGILLIFYIENKEIVKALINSAYPGNRRSIGGGISIFHIIGGMYNYLLLNDFSPPPQVLVNQSEGSSFFFLSIFILPLYIIRLIRKTVLAKTIDWIITLLSLYFIIMLLWGFGFLPKGLGSLLLLDRVLGQRVLLGLGITNHLLLFSFLFTEKTNDFLDNRKIIFSYSLVSMTLIFLVGLKLKNISHGFVSHSGQLIFVSIISGSLILFLLLKKRMIFSMVFLLWTLFSSLCVNPLYRGLSPLLNSPFSYGIEEVDRKVPEGSWIFYDELFLENYLQANGKTSLNGTYQVPVVEYWNQFDSDGKYENIYNRYAHVLVSNSEDEDQAMFVLSQPDLYYLMINPCNDLLHQMNINKFIFNVPQTHKCLDFERKIDLEQNSLYIYIRKE